VLPDIEDARALHVRHFVANQKIAAFRQLHFFGKAYVQLVLSWASSTASRTSCA
jgi:hypothetical protein